MNKMTKKIIGAFVGIITVGAIVLAGYFLLSKEGQKDGEETLPTTEVGKLLAKDLDTKYPETPTEVVKLYWRISSCIYNSDLSDKQFEKMLKQLRKLYDDEFLNSAKNDYKTMLKNFQKDKEKRNKAKEVFSATVVQKNDTLSVSEVDGKEVTSVVTATLIKAKSKSYRLYEEFMCRKDAKGKWKILGWRESNEKAADKAEIE